ncbi:MAG: hypothetical protein ACTSRA_17800 [Promethearchaeota archaeon]
MKIQSLNDLEEWMGLFSGSDDYFKVVEDVIGSLAGWKFTVPILSIIFLDLKLFGAKGFLFIILGRFEFRYQLIQGRPMPKPDNRVVECFLKDEAKPCTRAWFK